MSEPEYRDDKRAERRRGLFGRREYLRLAGAASVVGVGSSAFAGQASADDQPRRTLTIEGTGSRATYEFSVGGNVVKSTAMGASKNSNDTISGNSVSGEVGSGKDSYSFSGELTAFSMNGDARLYLNGEPLSDTVTVEDDSAGGPIHYELRVDGEVLKSTAMAATIDNNDEITPRDDPDSVEPITDAEPLAGETYVLGQVNDWKDSYSISGDITGFTANGSVNLYVNGELVTHPGKFVRTTLTFESKNGNRADYTFSTSGDISKSRAMGATINASDTAESGGASGRVSSGRDSYAYTGEITDFSGSSNLRVYLSRKQIDPATLSADPQFENTLTIEGNGGHTAYHFAVEGSLAENYGLSDEDSLDGNVANGRVRSGQDSYTFSGDISTFTADPEKGASFTTYLNGNEVDSETLGNVQTTPDAEDLPNEVEIRALTDARTEYGFGVSGTLATGDRSNTYSGDNASYEYARGWVAGEGLDNYRFSENLKTFTDFETFQISLEVGKDSGRRILTISSMDSNSETSANYEISFTGGVEVVDSGSGGNISARTATGTISNGVHKYTYTGHLIGVETDHLSVGVANKGDRMPLGSLVSPGKRTTSSDYSSTSAPAYMSTEQESNVAENRGEPVPGLVRNSDYVSFGSAYMDTGVQKMYSKWKVPERPPLYGTSDPVFFYFDGLMNNNSQFNSASDWDPYILLQPVLEWNRSSDTESQWTLSSWWVKNDEQYDHSFRIPVNKGDIIEGYMEYEQDLGIWTITTRNASTGESTGIATPDFSSYDFDIAYCVLEDANWDGYHCQYLPDGTEFKNVFVEDLNGDRFYPNFDGHVTGTSCAEVKSEIHAKSIEIQTRGPIF